ncbi:MAG TPA: DNA starvation/stationary phase protection protein [Acholeplasma sp.]|jgi:starvation-inducible DNA-binding protein|nr:DNA starvation/stationary phase protection protein [Acholeplasmatales bacterium]HHV33748.1 DNA starvation/stationary phase protection protein [Acholeplasma sp.]
MKLQNKLNEAVGNLILFYVKLHNYHWFVKGNQFYRLHNLFEQMYDEITETYDVIAERMLMLNMKPVATLKDSLAVATLKEATGNETTKEMIQQVLNDYKQLDASFKELLVLAEEANDDVTQDIMTSNRAVFQKHIWMLNALLK